MGVVAQGILPWLLLSDFFHILIGMETITLNRKQQARVEIIHRVVSGRLTKQEAAELLGVTRRQVDNILRRFREEGIKSVVHGNTGRTPINATPPETVEAILQLVGEGGPYQDLSVPHLRQFLARKHDIALARPTLDRILRKHGVRLTRRLRRTTARKRRERSPAEGMLVLIDASPHAWLEERGPRLTLVGAIDDATGKVLYLFFQHTENLQGYLRMLRGLFLEYGIPIALYHDRHTIFRSPKEATIEEELEGRIPLSQFGIVLDLLGIESIAAHSPQAKGRIERLWRTMQDRLLKELRLAGIDTLEQANAFLPDFIRRHNAEFAVAPADPKPVWAPIEAGMDLDYYLSTRESRVVRPDHTVSWLGKSIQLLQLRNHPVYPGTKVAVHCTIEGDILVYHDKTRLRHKVLDTPPVAPGKVASKPGTAKKIPVLDPEKRQRQCAWLHAGVG